MDLRFVPLAEKHLDSIVRWLREPHVAKFWSEPPTEAEIRAKYLGKRAKNIHGYVIELDSRPIGYVQHYEAWNVGPGWWPDATPGVYGLDVMIGEPSLTGKGIGTEALRRFLRDVLAKGREVKEIIADPDPANAAAIRAFEKLGFMKVGMVPTPYGDSLLYRLSPPAA
jgi:aminoglycoside 6'-N-acetyltransferase